MCERARDGAGPAPRDRLRAVAQAYYDWADGHRPEWALVFGAPVPTYAAPPEGSTTAAARRFGAAFTGVLLEVWAEHGERVQSPPVVQLRPDAVLTFGDVEVPEDPRFLGAAVRLWSRLHGVVALGLFGHLLPETLAADSVRRLYDAEVDEQLQVLGLG